MKLRITIGSALVLVVVAAVFATGASASSTGSSHYTQLGVKADGARLQAMARRYAFLQQHRPAASFYTRAALNAMGLRWLAMARTYGRPQVSHVSSGGGFNWADAGIGAATGSALAFCLVALIVVVRRPREAKLAA